MNETDAQKALDDFWEMVRVNYGNRRPLSDEDRKKLLELENQFIEARKTDAAKN